MTLMPVSNITARGSRVSKSGAGAVDLPVVLGLADGVGVERLAEHVEDVPEHGVAHRHPEAVAEVAHLGAPGQAVGGLQADAAHPAVADLLGHLGHDELLLALELDVDLDGAVDLGQGVGRELDVDDRAGDGHHPSGGQGLGLWWVGGRWWSWASCSLGFVAVGGGGRWIGGRRSVGHGQTLASMIRPPSSSSAPARRASAPPTISMISVVMVSWRARFMIREYFLISSPALSVAAAMARCRAVTSEADASSRAAKISVSAARGARVSSRMAASGSNSV